MNDEWDSNNFLFCETQWLKIIFSMFSTTKTCSIGVSIMIRVVLLFSLLTGSFPRRFCNNGKPILRFSKFGLLVNLLSCIFLVHRIYVLFELIIEVMEDTSPAICIKLAIKIINALFLLIIIIRRFIRAKNESEILNEMFNKISSSNKTWYNRYTEVVIVFVMELCGIAIEYGIFLYIRASVDTLYVYDLTLLIRMGFEIQIITVSSTVHRLYEFFNNFIRFDGPKNAPIMHNFRMQLENLHIMRVRLNDCFSVDLLLYFVNTQLIMLLECFESVKLFSTDWSTLEVLIRGLRVLRLFAILAYIIWRWCVVTNEVSRW